MMAGSIPPLVMPCVGNEEINSKVKLEKPFEKISHSITAKNKHTINVLPQRIAQLRVFTIFFFIRREIFLNDWQNILPVNSLPTLSKTIKQQ
jgi:hypothetical protein